MSLPSNACKVSNNRDRLVSVNYDDGDAVVKVLLVVIVILVAVVVIVVLVVVVALIVS